MARRTYLITIEHTGDEPDALDNAITQHLALPHSPFIQDYKQGAWGGYDGPFVTTVTVLPFDDAVTISGLCPNCDEELDEQDCCPTCQPPSGDDYPEEGVPLPSGI